MHRVREILSCSFRRPCHPLSTFRKWKARLAKSFLRKCSTTIRAEPGIFRLCTRTRSLAVSRGAGLKTSPRLPPDPSGFTSISTRIAGSRGPDPAGCAAGFRAIVVTEGTRPIGSSRRRHPERIPPAAWHRTREPYSIGSPRQLIEAHGMGEIMSWMLDRSLMWKDIETIAGGLKVPVSVERGILPAGRRPACR